MTDEDFEKVDEDFASEFDFVDTNDGAAPSGGSAQSSGNPGGGPDQPKGSPAIVGLMVLISVLGGGYYIYSSFFSKSPETVSPPVAPPAPGSDLPTLPEHTAGGAGNDIPGMTPPPSIELATPSKAEAAQAVADALNSKPAKDDLSNTFPMPTAPGGDRSFEQLQKEITQSQAAQPQQQVVSAEVKHALETLSQDMTTNVNNMRQLESTISNMSSTLDHLNKTISAMDNRVLTLTETVDGLSQDLANVKKVMVDQDLDLTLPGNVKMSSTKKQLQTISNSEGIYSVHAIIPGRAWLKSSGGQIITVTEGDKVGDYGTVAVIDATNGLVRTSSGIIIR